MKNRLFDFINRRRWVVVVAIVVVLGGVAKVKKSKPGRH
jgi:hypothetical protein